jgi:hypothetical protein
MSATTARSGPSEPFRSSSAENELIWDLGFLASGLVMLAAGALLLRFRHADTQQRAGFVASRASHS